MLVPGVAGLVEFEPGTLDGEFGVVAPVGGVTVPVGGVVAPVGGVTEPVGGVAVLVGGVAVPGACVRPAVPVLRVAGAVPPEGALCATTQVAQQRITERNAILLADISKPHRIKFSGARADACPTSTVSPSLRQDSSGTHREDA